MLTPILARATMSQHTTAAHRDMHQAMAALALLRLLRRQAGAAQDDQACLFSHAPMGQGGVSGSALPPLELPRNTIARLER